MPGRMLLDGGELRLEADVVGAPQAPSAADRSRACACSRSSSRRAARPSRRRRACFVLDRAGRPARRAASRRSGRSGSRCRSSRWSTPCACISSRSRQASSRSVWPIHVSAVSASKAWSAARAARRIFSISSSSLTARSPSTMPVVGTSSRPPEPSTSHLRVRQHVGLEREPPVEPLRRDRASASASSSSALTPGHPLGVQDVAEVGEELRLTPGLDEQRGVRATRSPVR